MSDLVQLTDAEIELVSGGNDPHHHHHHSVTISDNNFAIVNQFGLAIAVNVLSPDAVAAAAVSQSVSQS